MGIKVFFDPDNEEKLLAKDLITELYKIYHNECRFVACFVSKEYILKDFTMQEAGTARIRIKEEDRNPLILLSFEGAKLPDQDPDINYINASELKEVEAAHKLKLIVLEDLKNR